MGFGKKLKKLGRKINKGAKKIGKGAMKVGQTATNLATLGVAGKLMKKKRRSGSMAGGLTSGAIARRSTGARGRRARSMSTLDIG